MRDTERALVQAATAVARLRCRGENHTVAAAALGVDGRVFTGVNVYHFTGGPCAEVVAIGAAATQGVRELTAIVAVGDRGRGVLPPCGRCRQILLDYHPEIRVIVGAGDTLRAVPVTELLPDPYVWADQRLDDGVRSRFRRSDGPMGPGRPTGRRAATGCGRLPPCRTPPPSGAGRVRTTGSPRCSGSPSS